PSMRCGCVSNGPLRGKTSSSGSCYDLNKAPCGWTLGTSTLSSGASPLRGGGIRAAFDPLCLVIDHPIRWVPDAPHPHLTPTVRTDQGVPSCTLLVPLPIG